MAVNVRRATLWTIDTSNAPGSLASTLSPLADGNVNLDLVMGYSHPDRGGATIEVYPVDTSAAQKSAKRAGFSKSAFPCVAVSGENRAGLGRQIARALADAGININFFIAQVIDKRYTGMFSFEADSEADLAVKIIRDAVKRSPVLNKPARNGSSTKRPARKVAVTASKAPSTRGRRVARATAGRR